MNERWSEMTTRDATLLWPSAAGPEDLAEIERVPLEERGLPVSTYDALQRAAKLWPTRPAVSVMRNAEQWESPQVRTFGQLASDVHRFASALHSAGAGRGDAIALVSVNCDELLTALLAAEAIGVAAPINPGLAVDHARHLIGLSCAKVIVAAGPELDPAGWILARALADQSGVTALLALRPTGATGIGPELEPIPSMCVAYISELAAGAPDQLPVAPPKSDDFASCLHTGGTTGTPKLAARTHRNEVTNAWQVAASFVLADHDVIFAALPLFHTNALIVTVLAPLLRGQHVVWAGPLGYRDTPLFARFWKIVDHYRIAAMSGVPTVYAALAQVPVDADISSLIMPVVGAAPLPQSLMDSFREHTGLTLVEGYGLTEGTCASTRNFPGKARIGTVGQRLPYQQVKAVKICEETGTWQPLSPGQIGSIVIKGPNVFAGYLVEGSYGLQVDAGDKVREGWLDTGDLGSVDEQGFLRLAGRAKDLIIRGGHNIDPQVIEDALLSHPAVTAAGAVGQPDAHAGEVPVAYVTVAPGSDVSPDDLRVWASNHVPERAAAPKTVEIIDSIPLTPVGKPFKNELRRRATERAARDVLPEVASVVATLHDGTVVVKVGGIRETVAAQLLAPYAFHWQME